MRVSCGCGCWRSAACRRRDGVLRHRRRSGDVCAVAPRIRGVARLEVDRRPGVGEVDLDGAGEHDRELFTGVPRVLDRLPAGCEDNELGKHETVRLAVEQVDLDAGCGPNQALLARANDDLVGWRSVWHEVMEVDPVEVHEPNDSREGDVALAVLHPGRERTPTCRSRRRRPTGTILRLSVPPGNVPRARAGWARLRARSRAAQAPSGGLLARDDAAPAASPTGSPSR